MVQVGRPELPGYGAQAAPKPGIMQTKQLAEGEEGQSIGYVPQFPVFDPRGAFQVPNNFWGFVMLMMGLKS